MTALWRELRSVLTVGAITGGVVLAFPLSALDFKARPVPSEAEATAAFVHLTAEEEEQVLKAAKTTWQEESSAMQRMRVRLPLGDLPEEEPTQALDLTRLTPSADAQLEPLPYRLPGYSPSAAAAVPTRLPPEPEARPVPAFSRGELLNLTERNQRQ